MKPYWVSFSYISGMRDDDQFGEVKLHNVMGAIFRFIPDGPNVNRALANLIKIHLEEMNMGYTLRRVLSITPL